MAEAEANPSLGGYDDDFVSEVEDELQCAICRLPLKDPILTKCVVTEFAETALTVISQGEGNWTITLNLALYGVIILFKYAMLFCVCDHLSSELDLAQVFDGIGKVRRFEEYIHYCGLFACSLTGDTCRNQS